MIDIDFNAIHDRQTTIPSDQMGSGLLGNDVMADILGQNISPAEHQDFNAVIIPNNGLQRFVLRQKCFIGFKFGANTSMALRVKNDVLQKS